MPLTNPTNRLPGVVEDALGLAGPHEALVVEVLEGGVIQCSSPPPVAVPACVLRPSVDDNVVALALVVPPPSNHRLAPTAHHRISHLGVHVERGGGSLSFLVRNGRATLRQPGEPNVLDDVARRRLALPTPSPMIGTGWYWSLVWIVEIVREVDHLPPGELLEVLVSAAVHPAAQEWSAGAGLGRQTGPADLTSNVVQAHRHLVRTRDWDHLRRAAIRSELPLGQCAPWFASRLDAGSFSRWLSSTLPAIDDLVPALVRSLDHESQRLVGAVLADVLADRRWTRLGALLDGDEGRVGIEARPSPSTARVDRLRGQ